MSLADRVLNSARDALTWVFFDRYWPIESLGFFCLSFGVSILNEVSK